MKKTLFVGFFALVCLFSNAQEGLKGTWFAGGSFGINSDTNYADEEKLKSESYTIMPLLGRFVTPSIAVGGAIGYTHIKSQTHTKGDQFTIMPLARKYWNIAGGLYFYGQMALPVGFSNLKHDTSSSSDIKSSSVSLQLSPGFDLIINSWLTVEASFVLASAGYSSYKPKGGETSNSWSLNGNSISSSKFGDLSVGVKFLF